MNATSYRVVRHPGVNEIWVLRLEGNELTGAYGPLPPGAALPVPDTLDYEEHPDDLEWILRAAHAFEVLKVM